MRSTKFYSAPKDLILLKAKLKVTLHESDNTFTVSADRVVRYLFINSKKQHIHFSDNYFDVVPGYPVLIKVLSKGLKLTDLKK